MNTLIRQSHDRDDRCQNMTDNDR